MKARLTTRIKREYKDKILTYEKGSEGEIVKKEGSEATIAFDLKHAFVVHEKFYEEIPSDNGVDSEPDGLNEPDGVEEVKDVRDMTQEEETEMRESVGDIQEFTGSGSIDDTPIKLNPDND